MMACFETDADVERIALGLASRTLPKADWTHAAHFAAALWLIRNRPEVDAAAHMPVLIRAYNEATGVPNTPQSGYHETITQASLRSAAAFLRGQPEALPLSDVANRLMASPLGRSDWLLAYWSKARLFSVEARLQWVEPDLKPLPD